MLTLSHTPSVQLDCRVILRSINCAASQRRSRISSVGDGKRMAHGPEGLLPLLLRQLANAASCCTKRNLRGASVALAHLQ
jgi:hypothetical protein